MENYSHLMEENRKHFWNTNKNVDCAAQIKRSWWWWWWCSCFTAEPTGSVEVGRWNVCLSFRSNTKTRRRCFVSTQQLQPNYGDCKWLWMCFIFHEHRKTFNVKQLIGSKFAGGWIWKTFAQISRHNCSRYKCILLSALLESISTSYEGFPHRLYKVTGQVDCIKWVD